MEKIARFIVGLVAFAVIGGAGYLGLRTSADAQSGGGLPSQPTFQTVRIGGGLPIGGTGTLQTTGTIQSTVGNLQISNGVARISCSAVLSDPLTVCSTADHTTVSFKVQNGTTSYLTAGAGLQPIPQMLAFNIGFNGAGAPVLQQCLHCGSSPSATRTGVGTYSVTHNAAIGLLSLVACTPANGTPTYAYEAVVLSNTATIQLLTFAGAAVDGTAAQSLSCIAIT
jgi:hypothetical protein